MWTALRYELPFRIPSSRPKLRRLYARICAVFVPSQPCTSDSVSDPRNCNLREGRDRCDHVRLGGAILHDRRLEHVERAVLGSSGSAQDASDTMIVPMKKSAVPEIVWKAVGGSLVLVRRGGGHEDTCHRASVVVVGIFASADQVAIATCSRTRPSSAASRISWRIAILYNSMGGRRLDITHGPRALGSTARFEAVERFHPSEAVRRRAAM